MAHKHFCVKKFSTIGLISWNFSFCDGDVRQMKSPTSRGAACLLGQVRNAKISQIKSEEEILSA